jgi:hypothetical protein
VEVSGRDFVWLYQRCDTVAFLDGHVRAFAYLGGVLSGAQKRPSK